MLGLVCEKMVDRVVFPRQEEEDRRVRQEESRITQDDTSETTEGVGVDFLTELLELVGYPQVNDDETEKDLS